MLNLIIIGAPGSGKGTQAELIQENFGIRHLSTGAQIRKEIANGTKLGLLAEPYVEAGSLVPDELVHEIVETAIQENKNGLVFDGYPRSLAQDETLEKLLAKYEQPAVKFLIYLPVDKEKLLERVLERGKTSGRSDDTVEVFEERYKAYLEATAPLVDSYRKKGLLIEIDGHESVEKIFGEHLKQLIETNL